MFSRIIYIRKDVQNEHRVRDMNDNDKPDFASKLSLAPLNEDVANNQLKMVCPKCGYKPEDTSDPLLTKHNGLGECPKCGVIPKKYLQIKGGQSNPTHLQQKETRIAVDHNRRVRDRKGRKFGILSFTIGVVLFFGVFSFLKPKDQSKVMVDEAKKILSQFPYDIRGAWQGQVVHEVKFRPFGEGYAYGVPENVMKEELENPTASGYTADYNIRLMIDENYVVKEIEWTDRHTPQERSVISWADPSYVEYFMEARGGSFKERALQQPFVRYFTVQRDANRFSMEVSNSPHSADPDILLEPVPIPDVAPTQQPTRNIFRYDEKEQAMRAEVVAAFIPILKKLNVPLNSIKNWYVTPRNAYDGVHTFLANFINKRSETLQEPVNGFYEELDFKFTLNSGCFTFWVTQAKLSLAFFQRRSEGGSRFEEAKEDGILHLSTSSTVEVSADCAPTAEILFYKDGRKLVRIKDRNIAAGKPLEYSISKIVN